VRAKGATVEARQLVTKGMRTKGAVIRAPEGSNRNFSKRSVSKRSDSLYRLYDDHYPLFSS
jgi:hypothetical protein